MTGDSVDPPSVHVPIMVDEIVEAMASVQPRVMIDGTFGGGGHTEACLKSIPSLSRVVAIDRDPGVQTRFENRDPDERIDLFVGSHSQSGRALESLGIQHADAMLLDLGLSSDQLADPNRGFSFQTEGELDLRFDPTRGEPAWRWLAMNSERVIADAIYQYGEERFSRRIARAIVERAKMRRPIRMAAEMAEVCRRCVPRSKNHDIHPATRTFQALRIVVNDELREVESTLDAAADWIRPGGVFAVLSFHSLEDRLVKNAFRDADRWQRVTRKPMRPSESEVADNPRSRSAKLRIARRIDEP